MPHGDCAVEDELTQSWGHPLCWMEAVHELTGEEPSLRNAFSALVISRVAKELQDQNMARVGTSSYLQSLQQLQMALRDAGRVFSDEVLVASLLLGVYEVLEGAMLESNDSWLRHAQGAAQLIELRGADRHATPLAHKAFLTSRVMIIYAGLLQPQATFLATEVWRTAPWDSQHRTYLDRLIDIATAIPGLLERVNNFRSKSAQSPSLKEDVLLSDLIAVQKAINSWKRYLKKEATAQEVRHISTEADDAYPFRTKLWFDNHIFAYAASLYHTFSLALAEAVGNLLGGSPRSQDPATEYAALFDARHHAGCIVRLIPYCLQPDMGGLGVSIMILPANLALRYFVHEDEGSIAAWLTKMLTQNRQGFSSSTVRQATPGRESQHRTQSPTAKSESSDEVSELSRWSTPTERRPSQVLVKFVHEDPSRHYNDMSGEQLLTGELAIRARNLP